MLDVGHEQCVIDDLWASASPKAHMPMLMGKSFFDQRGPMPTLNDSKRSYHRFYLRSRAIVKHKDKLLGAYTKDVSRQGIGFLSPVQMMPMEHIDVQLPNGASYNLEITRCRRVEESCYDCGAKFVL
jgi:hypothetical protein